MSPPYSGQSAVGPARSRTGRSPPHATPSTATASAAIARPRTRAFRKLGIPLGRTAYHAEESSRQVDQRWAAGESVSPFSPSASTPSRVDGDPACPAPAVTPDSASIERLRSTPESELVASPSAIPIVSAGAVKRRLRVRSRRPSARRLRVLICQVAPVLAGHAPMQIDQPTPQRSPRTARVAPPRRGDDSRAPRRSRRTAPLRRRPLLSPAVGSRAAPRVAMRVILEQESARPRGGLLGVAEGALAGAVVDGCQGA